MKMTGIRLFCVLVLQIFLCDFFVFSSGAQEISPEYVVPGTKWVYLIKSVDGRADQCEVDLTFPLLGEPGRGLIAFAIGSKGAPVILLRDKYIERVVRESIGWKSGQSYKVVLILLSRGYITVDVQAEIMDEETLIIFLPKEQRFLMSEIYRAERLFITVGGVAHNTYELLGLPEAIKIMLRACPIKR
jgi:hypothetical protein